MLGAAMKRVLVVEDDPDIVELIFHYLEGEGFHVEALGNGEEALRRIRDDGFDLLILDLQLPGMDGLSLCAALRRDSRTEGLPVIMLTARGDEADRVVGLEVGADDYVVKPFSVRELLARIEAVLRRSAERHEGPRLLHVPAGIADLRRSEVRPPDGGKRDRRVELSERELALLTYLARNPRRVVGRDELLLRVWRLPASASHTRAIDMLVVRLREKLGDDATSPHVLVTVRGRGYMLAENVRIE